MNEREGGAGHLTAVARGAIETGALISFSGDTLVASGDGIVAAIESRLTSRTASNDGRDRWLTDAVPVLARGAAEIVPLAWVPPHQGRGDGRDRTLGDRVDELWSAVRGACWYRHGEQIGIDLPPDDGRASPYASELVRTGARRADWWEFGDWAVVLVVYGEPIPAPLSLIAVHVVPVGWVSERRRTPPKKMPTLDLEWSWGDVVAFARTADADAADNLADQKKSQEQ